MATHGDSVQLVPNGGWDPRILVCRCGTLVDTFIVLSERYVVIVDTVLNPAAGKDVLAIAEPWLATRQLLVVNTHADWDHAWGNQVFASPGGVHPAPILASRACGQRLRSREAADRLAAMRAEQPGRFDEVVLTPPTLLFERELTIHGGDLTLELFPTPGHTHDHISVFIPEIQTLLAGDAAELPFPFVESAASMPLLRQSLARMAALEPASALYCHAPTDIGPGLLGQNMAYFDTIEARCRAALDRGVQLPLAHDADVEALVGFPFEAALPDGADAASLSGFYRPGHQSAIRAMLEYLHDIRPA